MCYIQVDLLLSIGPIIQQVKGTVGKKLTKTDLVLYQHPLLVNPTSNALLKGIKQGFLATFPGLDEKTVTDHLPPLIDTSKVHLQQDRQVLQSTKLQTNPELEDTYTLEGPTHTNVFMVFIFKCLTGKSYGDLTDQYTKMSSSVNQ